MNAAAEAKRPMRLPATDGPKRAEELVPLPAISAAPLEPTSIANPDQPEARVTRHPEVVDDFVRNFLASKGLLRSLDAFQVRPSFYFYLLLLGT